MVPLYSPISESESSVISSLLEAHQIPFFIRGAAFGKLYPGLQINHYNTQTFMVHESDFVVARELLTEFWSPKTTSEQIIKATWGEKIRVVGEALIFGWFVPGKRDKEKNEINP